MIVRLLRLAQFVITALSILIIVLALACRSVGMEFSLICNVMMATLIMGTAAHLPVLLRKILLAVAVRHPLHLPVLIRGLFRCP